MIPWPSEEQLEHNIVRQQDVRRVGQDLLPFLLFLLTSITAEGNGGLACGGPLDEEFFQFLLLAVGQGIHGIDDNGADALATPLAEYKIDNGDDVREALARPGARGEDVAVTRRRCINGLGLMLVEAQGLACAIR
jgi:hypothetical protein